MYLKQALCFIAGSNLLQMNLDDYETTCIAGTLKKYLRELPNSVIPEENYTKFIDAASESYMLLISAVNSWHAENFGWNINIPLHFKSFLDTEM